MRRETRWFLVSAVSWLLVVLLLIVTLHTAGMKPHDWEFERKLANKGYATHPRVALSEDAIHMVYFDHPALDESLYAYERAGVVHMKSDDKGRSWSEQVICTACNALRESVAIASSGDSVYVAWSMESTYSSYEIRVAVSHDQGSTWDAPRRVATHPYSPVDLLDIQAEDDLVFITYVMRSTLLMSGEHLFVTSSEDRGINWSEVRGVPENARAPYSSQLIDGVLFVSTCLDFGDNNLSFLLSTSDFGATWTSSEIGNPQDSGVCALDMTIMDGQIGILSYGGYTRADVESLNWSRLDSNATGFRLLRSGGSLLAFEYSRDDGIYVRLGSDDGIEWGQKFRLLEFNENYQRVNDMRSFGSEVALVWVERRGAEEFRSEEVYLKVSHDSGTTWSDPIRATDHYSELAVPLFAVSVSLFLMVTPLTIWSWRALARARRERPILLWPSERLSERKSSNMDQEGD